MNKYTSIIMRYIAIVILPTVVVLSANYMWNKIKVNKPEVLEQNLVVYSQDLKQIITVLEGSEIIREDVPPTLPPPAISTTLPSTATAIPATEKPIDEGNTVMARLSYYWPPLGPPNCIGINWTGTECTSMLWDGEVYKHWSYFAQFKSTACPEEYEIGQRFDIPGFGVYKCVDRGGAIETLPDGSIFLDLMTWEIPYCPERCQIVTDIYSPAGSYVLEVRVLD